MDSNTCQVYLHLFCILMCLMFCEGGFGVAALGKGGRGGGGGGECLHRPARMVIFGAN